MTAVYEAPKLTRLGNVAALTASDMKCSPGADLYGMSVPWYARHDPQTPGEEWDEATPSGQLTGNTVGALDYARLITSGECAGANVGVHPVTGL